MNGQQHLMLPIPGPAEFEEDRPYLAVPASVVSAGIELLHCILGQWKLEEGLSPDKRVWDALAVSGAQMPSSLMDVWAAEDQERTAVCAPADRAAGQRARAGATSGGEEISTASSKRVHVRR